MSRRTFNYRRMRHNSGRYEEPPAPRHVDDNWRSGKPMNIDKEFQTISNQISTLNMESNNDGPATMPTVTAAQTVAAKVPGLIQLPAKMTHSSNRRGSGGGAAAGGGGNGGGGRNSHHNNNYSNSNSNNCNQNGREQRRPQAQQPGNNVVREAQERYFCGEPVWYDRTSEAFRQVHDQSLIEHVKECDSSMQQLIAGGLLVSDWETFDRHRQRLKRLLHQFLMHEIKFCGQYNVEGHFWKLICYNVIEAIKKAAAGAVVAEQQPSWCKETSLAVVEDGLQFFEQMLKVLEDQYKFRIDDYIGSNAPIATRGLKLTGLALVSTQKMFLYLGDLARYKEAINETTSYGVARQWYTKAQQIMPSNGRPYYQLGLLSFYSVCGGT